MSRILPGQAGEPLPSGEWVLRLAVVSKDFHETGRVSPEVFALSTEDRQGDPPRLSVWAERLTRPGEAWELMGRKPSYRLVVRLNVDVIRAIPPNPESPDAPGLEVVWDPLLTPEGDPDARPGAAGHAGIVGLHAGTSVHRKSCRRRLSQLGSQDVRWLEQPESAAPSPP